MKFKKTISLITAVTFALSLTGCSSSSNNANSDNSKFTVVATTTQICDYVKHIANNDIKLTCLLQPNASAHELDVTREQLDALQHAKVLLTNGVDLEKFLEKSIKASGFAGEIVDTSKGISLNKWTFTEGNEPPEFTHDPHVWTNPLNAKIQVENIVKALAKADPSQADTFKTNGATYEQALTSLDSWAEKSINTIPKDERILFTSHDAFGYFSKRYGIQFIGAAIPNFSDLAETTAEHIKDVVNKIKDSKAKVIFAENSNSDKNLRTIANETGVKLVTQEDALYGDSLGPKGSEGETYIGSIIHNVTSFVTALGGQVQPLPTDIEKYAP